MHEPVVIHPHVHARRIHAQAAEGGRAGVHNQGSAQGVEIQSLPAQPGRRRHDRRIGQLAEPLREPEVPGRDRDLIPGRNVARIEVPLRRQRTRGRFQFRDDPELLERAGQRHRPPDRTRQREVGQEFTDDRKIERAHRRVHVDHRNRRIPVHRTVHYNGTPWSTVQGPVRRDPQRHSGRQVPVHRQVDVPVAFPPDPGEDVSQQLVVQGRETDRGFLERPGAQDRPAAGRAGQGVPGDAIEQGQAARRLQPPRHAVKDDVSRQESAHGEGVRQPRLQLRRGQHVGHKAQRAEARRPGYGQTTRNGEAAALHLDPCIRHVDKDLVPVDRDAHVPVGCSVAESFVHPAQVFQRGLGEVQIEDRRPVIAARVDMQAAAALRPGQPESLRPHHDVVRTHFELATKAGELQPAVAERKRQRDLVHLGRQVPIPVRPDIDPWQVRFDSFHPFLGPGLVAHDHDAIVNPRSTDAEQGRLGLVLRSGHGVRLRPDSREEPGETDRLARLGLQMDHGRPDAQVGNRGRSPEELRDRVTRADRIGEQDGPADAVAELDIVEGGTGQEAARAHATDRQRAVERRAHPLEDPIEGEVATRHGVAEDHGGRDSQRHEHAGRDDNAPQQGRPPGAAPFPGSIRGRGPCLGAAHRSERLADGEVKLEAPQREPGFVPKQHPGHQKGEVFGYDPVDVVGGPVPRRDVDPVRIVVP